MSRRVLEIHRVIRGRLENLAAVFSGTRLARNRNFTILRGRRSGEQPRKPCTHALFGNASLGTKGVICVSGNHPEATMSGSRDQNRIQLVDPDHATGAIRRLFAEIQAKFALMPNLFRVHANAPAALEGLMGLGSALAAGALDEKTREQLALAIAESNLCPYCLSGHTAMAAKIGLSQAENRRRHSRQRGRPEDRCHP
jgi:AhpD family alkylhydroperoxidase